MYTSAYCLVITNVRDLSCIFDHATNFIFVICNCNLLPLDTGYDQVQVTLVDCPGHASLIRTIIGGQYVLLIKKCVKFSIFPYC